MAIAMLLVDFSRWKYLRVVVDMLLKMSYTAIAAYPFAAIGRC